MSKYRYVRRDFETNISTYTPYHFYVYYPAIAATDTEIDRVVGRVRVRPSASLLPKVFTLQAVIEHDLAFSEPLSSPMTSKVEFPSSEARWVASGRGSTLALQEFGLAK